MLKAIDESIEMAKRFENVLKQISRPVAFNPNWRSENGEQYDGAVNTKLPTGSVVKSVDPDSGRRLILIGTDLDTVVIYEQYSPNSKGSSFGLVYNANAALDFLLGGSRLSIAQFSLAITDYDIGQNIGFRLRNLNSRINRRAAHNVPDVEEVARPK